MIAILLSRLSCPVGGNQGEAGQLVQNQRKEIVQVKHLFEANANDIAHERLLSLWEWFHGSEIKQLYLVDSIIKNFYAMGLVHYLHELSEGIKARTKFLDDPGFSPNDFQGDDQ